MKMREKLNISTKDLAATAKSPRGISLMLLTTTSFIVLSLSTAIAQRVQFSSPTALMSYLCTFYMMNNCYLLMVLLISQEGKNLFPMKFLYLLHGTGMIISVLQVVSVMTSSNPDPAVTLDSGPTYTTVFFCVVQIFLAGAYLGNEWRYREKNKNPSKDSKPSTTANSRILAKGELHQSPADAGLKGQGPNERMSAKKNELNPIAQQSTSTTSSTESPTDEASGK